MSKGDPKPELLELKPVDKETINAFYENRDFVEFEKAKRTSTNTGLTPYSGDWGKRETLHLLKRVLFGVKPSELEHFSSMSLNECLDELIQTDPDPEPPINDYTEEADFDPDVPLGESWVLAAKGSNEINVARISSLNSWLIRNIARQPSTIHEKMIIFWHNLLPTAVWGVANARMSFQYFSLLRKHSLGNYKTLIRELTTDPAVLYYLNGARNRKDAPDENYARELQELFTVGKGSGSGYTESDVQEAARLLTGFTVWWLDKDKPGEQKSVFYHPYHDTGDKTFSSFYGNRVIKGRSGNEGVEELDELLDMIFDVEEVSKYICRRLYSFFVHSEVDESAETNVITPLAQLFRDSNYEIMLVVKALLGSEHFYDEINRGATIKNPLDHLLGFWRTTETEEVEPENPFIIYWLYKGVQAWYLTPTGMSVGSPPSVAGWPPFYQAPSLDRIWITTDSITKRAERMEKTIYGSWWVWRDGRYLKTDLIKFAERLPNPSEPTVLIQDIWDLLMGIDATEESLAHLKSVLLSDQTSDYYWTNAWSDYQKNKNNTAFKQTVETRLQSMVYAMSQLGEFQLT
ncbi:MAG: DUF1800 domain-containing protein [Cyclobacteriaceae bacterium]